MKLNLILVLALCLPALGAYHRTALKYHNKYRALHGASALQLDEELNRAADEYVTAYFQSPGRARQPTNLGQNLFEYFGSGSNDLPHDDELVEMAVDYWYSGIKTYDWQNPKTSTFSQVVWRGTDKLGVAVGRIGRTKAVVVAMYAPPGNVLGQFDKNVWPVGDYSVSPSTSSVAQATTAPAAARPSTSNVVVGYVEGSTAQTVVPKATSTYVEASSSGATTSGSGTSYLVASTRQPAASSYLESSTSRKPVVNNYGEATIKPVVANYVDSTTNRRFSTNYAESSTVQNRMSEASTAAPALPSAPVAEVSERDVQAIAVDLHNALREKHGAPALRLDEELNRAAQDYAYSLASGKSKRRTEHGQNLFWFTGFTLPPDEAVRKAVNEWYNSKSIYNWREPLSSPNDAKSFSQLVWKASRKIGIGVATRRNGNIVVALYGPPGNILSEKAFIENVAPEVQ